jgi:hypothetical protein
VSAESAAVLAAALVVAVDRRERRA